MKTGIKLIDWMCENPKSLYVIDGHEIKTLISAIHYVSICGDGYKWDYNTSLEPDVLIANLYEI